MINSETKINVRFVSCLSKVGSNYHFFKTTVEEFHCLCETSAKSNTAFVCTIRPSNPRRSDPYFDRSGSEKKLSFYFILVAFERSLKRFVCFFSQTFRRRRKIVHQAPRVAELICCRVFLSTFHERPKS